MPPKEKTINEPVPGKRSAGPIRPYQFAIPATSSRTLREVLQRASPFLAPLKLTQLLELIYVEGRNNPAVRSRIKAFAEPFPNPRQITTARLHPKIVAWATNLTALPISQAVSHLVLWILMDYPWAFEHFTYHGLTRGVTPPSESP